MSFAWLKNIKFLSRTRVIWDFQHPRFKALRDTCLKNNETAYYRALAPKMNNEELCNLLVTLIYQTISMLDKMIELVKEDFLKNGGIKEQMHRARVAYRSSNIPK